MTLFLCKLWPYLAGGLIGWLLAGWFARRLKHVEPPIERIVEKHVDRVVDNPKHLSLIGKLQNENKKIPDLVSRIASFESNKSASSNKIVEKTIEKVVDNPKHLARIKELESENKNIATLKSRISSFENQQSKATDNPEHLKRINELEAQVKNLQRGPTIDLKAAKAAGISIKDDSDFTAIEGIGPKISDLIHADGIQTFPELADTSPFSIQKILDNAGPNYTMANPGTWPDQANLAATNRWGALKALQDVLDGGVYPGTTKKATAKAGSSGSTNISKKVKAKKAVVVLDVEAAKAAGFKVKQKDGQDDFTVIEGIGPKINELIHADGIHTFTELSETLVDVVQGILDKAGSRYKLAKPGTWPAQAEMAASNRWDTLKAWQDKLDGGE